MSGTKNHRGWGWIRKRASGRYQASYIGPDGRRHFAPATFEHKMEAEEWLSRERREIQSALTKLSGTNTNTDSASLTLYWISPSERVEAIKAGLVHTLEEYGRQVIAERDIKPKTRITYTALFEQHIVPTLGKLSVNRLTPQIVRTWYAKTLVDKPTSRAHAYGLLKMICNTAVKDELLERNPCMIGGAARAKTTKQVQILEVDEVAALADAIQPENLKALVLISAWCGLRYGEVTELRRGDIGPDAEVITVSRGVVHRKGCHILTPKSGKVRTVVVPPHIRADILQHLDTFVGKDADSLLFAPARGGCHLWDKVFWDSFSDAAKKVGRQGISHHQLRHFATSMTDLAGASMIENMRRIGHATPDMTLRYSHAVRGRDVEIVQDEKGQHSA